MSEDHNSTGWRKRQIALEKKADNARELGLDYEPSIVKHDPSKEQPMNREDIIRMAKNSGLFVELVLERDLDWLERFAELVRADERHRTWTQDHWTEYEQDIAAQEREACARLAEEWLGSTKDRELHIAEAIRARGNT